MSDYLQVPLAMGTDVIAGGTYQLPPWIYPPAEFWPIDQVNYIPVPAIGTGAPVVSFRVPTGHNGIILLYGNNFVGGGFQEGAGTIVWQITRDNAAIDGYDNIVASLGLVSSPTRHPSGFRIFENQVISLTVSNVSIVIAGQLTGGRLAGWYYPKEYEDQNITTM